MVSSASVFFFTVTCFNVVISLEYSPLVKTVYGTVRGTVMTSSGGRNYYAYRKIPYAAPPIGNLRFQGPKEPKSHKGILDATQDSEDCLQFDDGFNSYPLNQSTFGMLVGSEDCLYLNVYTPNINPKDPLPVMFHIHGGGFLIGSGSSMLFGPEHFMDKDIVLVSINYRLGILGFLSLENQILPGNLGLKDQSAALKWAHNNIIHFGGDPNSITIFGQSAGGASVHLQMLSKSSIGLFHHAISQSGNINCPWALSQPGEPRKLAKSFSKIVNCPEEDSSLIKCLQVTSVEKIFAANKEMIEKVPFGRLLLRPVLEENNEDAFISQESIEKAPPIPWVTGVTSKEGLLIYDHICKMGDADLHSFNRNYKKMLPITMYLDDIPEKTSDITAKVKNFYLGDKPFSKETADATVDMFGDRYFLFPHMKGLAKHRGDLFCYYFTFRGDRSFTDLFGTSHVKGVDHGDELFLLFHMKKFYPLNEYNKNDKKMSELLINYWTNFATFGYPSSRHSESIKWEKYESNKRCLEISENEVLMKDGAIFPDRMKLWNDIESMQSIDHIEL